MRVFERPDADGLWMSCAWDTTASGRPRETRLPDHWSEEKVKAFADLTAARRRERVLSGRRSRATREDIRLGELWRRYLASARAQRWSGKHRGDVERSREFWLLQLGEDRRVLELSPAEVERIAQEAEERAGWGVRKHRKLLAHIRAATRWGCDKAQLYDIYPLRGLELPDYEPETDDLFYDAETETPKLLAGHPDADWRDVLAVNVAADTGRRISAILALRTDDILADQEDVYLRFRKEYDKGKRTATVPVSAETAELLAQAVERDIVSESGWLFPEGRLDLDDPRDKPREKSTAIRGLHELERLVGVKRVKGRGYHGLKRAHVTAGMEASSGDTALVGDVTGNVSAELIRRTYRKGSRRRSREHVERIRGRLSGGPTEAEKPPENTHESTHGGETDGDAE